MRPDADVIIQFEEDVHPITALRESVVAFTTQSDPGILSRRISGDTIILGAAAPYHPGEIVQVTAAAGIANANGDSLLPVPVVWQFRAAARGATGRFGDDKQRLGHFASEAVALGDLDGDGDLDAFVANSHQWQNDVAGRSTVWLNDGNGDFVDSGQRLASSTIGAVALADLDGDGDLDAFIANAHECHTDICGGVPNEVWLNDGDGNFVDSGQRLGSSDSRAIALGDLDGDGDLDAYVANSRALLCLLAFGCEGPFHFRPETPSGTDRIWLNDGSGQFSGSGRRLDPSFGRAVSLGDLDGDGDLDAFVANSSSRHGPNRVFLNDGTGNLTDSGQRLGNSQSSAVELGDLDGDGDLDAFVANGYSESNRVWLNDGSGHFVDSEQRLGQSDSNAISLSDVDGDGDLDAFVANGSWDELQANTVWLNNGAGRFGDSGQRLGRSVSSAVSMGDLEGDGDLDAFVGNSLYCVDDQCDAMPNTVWINEDVIGDSNRDGVFSGSDFVTVFLAGKYEDGIPGNATFDEGDWNQDGDFDSSDLVFAFRAGHYVAGAKPQTSQIAAAVEWLFADDEDGKSDGAELHRKLSLDVD